MELLCIAFVYMKWCMMQLFKLSCICMCYFLLCFCCCCIGTCDRVIQSCNFFCHRIIHSGNLSCYACYYHGLLFFFHNIAFFMCLSLNCTSISLSLLHWSVSILPSRLVNYSFWPLSHNLMWIIWSTSFLGFFFQCVVWRSNAPSPDGCMAIAPDVLALSDLSFFTVVIVVYL